MRFVDIIVVDKHQRILLLRRSENSDFMPGKLCLPGGHLDEGLSLSQAAKKELEEECGILVKNITKVTNYTFDNGHDSTTIFICFENIKIGNKQYINWKYSDKILKLTFDEHSEYMWLKPSEIKSTAIRSQLMDNVEDYLFKII